METTMRYLHHQKIEGGQDVMDAAARWLGMERSHLRLETGEGA